MKYFIGKKFKTQKLEKLKKELEQIFLEMNLEGEENLIDNITKNKIETVCRSKFDFKDIDVNLKKFITLFLEDENNGIIGFLNFDINKKDSYIEIHFLCSIKEEKYKGNGKLLIETIKQFAKNANISQIYLTPANGDLINYYEKNGFEEDRLSMVYNIKGGKTRKTRKNNDNIL